MATTDALDLCEEVARRMSKAILKARDDGQHTLAIELTYARDIWLKAAAKEKGHRRNAFT